MPHSSSARAAKLSAAVALALAVALFLSAVPVPADVTLPSYGDTADDAEVDFTPSVRQITSDIKLARWDRGTANVATDDCYYIAFHAASPLAAGDLHLGGDLDSSDCNHAGKLLKSNAAPGSDQIGKTVEILGDLSTFIGWVETDRQDGLSDLDLIYVDLDSTTPAEGCTLAADNLGICDIRLVKRSTPSVNYGDMVDAADADLAESADADGTLPDTATLTADATMELWYYDDDENRALNDGDTLYLRLTTGGPGSQESPSDWAALVPLVMDIRLTNYAGSGAGEMVETSDADHLPTLEAPPANTVVRAGDGTDGIADNADDPLFLSWQSDGDTPVTVHWGDIALNTVSGRTAGTTVTTTSTGLGTSISAATGFCTGASTDTFDELVFWVDTNSDGRYGVDDGVYMNRPTCIGGPSDTRSLTLEDIRLADFKVGSTSMSKGTVVGQNDADYVSFKDQGETTVWTLKWYNHDRSNDLQTLTTLKDAKIGTNVSANGAWSAGEVIYVEKGTVDNVIAAGDTRVTRVEDYGAGTSDFAQGSTVASGDPDVGATVEALTNAKVTGTDGSWSSGSEYVYVSANNIVNAGDQRVNLIDFNNFDKDPDEDDVQTVVVTDADVATEMGEGDALYLSPTGVSTTSPASKIPLLHDVRMLKYGSSGSYGAKVKKAEADFTPRLVGGPTLTLYHLSLGGGGFLDDSFYASSQTASSSTPANGDARLVAALGEVAGAMVQPSSGDGTQTITEDTGAAFPARVCFINPGTSTTTAYDSNDLVYVNTAFFTSETSGVLDQFYVRLATTTGLTTNYAAGTIVKAGDADLQSYGADACGTHATTPAAHSFKLKFVDQDADFAWDAGGSTVADQEHLAVGSDFTTCTTNLCSAIMRLGDLFLTTSGTTAPTNAATTTTATTTATTTPTTTATTTQQQQTTTSAAISSTGATGSETINPDQNETEEAPTPGIGLVVAIAAIAGAVLVAARRREDD